MKLTLMYSSPEDNVAQKKGIADHFLQLGAMEQTFILLGRCIGHMRLTHHGITREAFRQPNSGEFIRHCLGTATILYKKRFLSLIMFSVI